MKQDFYNDTILCMSQKDEETQDVGGSASDKDDEEADA